MKFTFNKKVLYILIAFIAITLSNALIDIIFGDIIDWGLNMFLSIFSIGTFLLFGGLLQKIHIK